MRSLLIVPLVLTLAGVALGQSPDNKEEADKLFREGMEASARKDYATARDKFGDAYKKFPSPNALFNLAKAEQLLGKCIDSVKHFEAYIALPDNPRLTVEKRDEAGTNKAECLKRIVRLVIKAPAGTKPVLDGASVAWTAGEPIDVEAGDHDLRLQGPDGEKKRPFHGDAGQVLHVDYAEEKVRVLPPSGLPEGKTETYRPAAGVVVPIALAGVGVVGIVLGGVFGAMSQGAETDRAAAAPSAPCANPNSTTCASFRDTVDAKNLDSTLSVVSYVAGAALLVGGVVSFLVWPKSERAITVTPVVGMNGLGFALGGRF